MPISEIFRKPIGHLAAGSTFTGLVVRDALGTGHSQKASLQERLTAAVNWLLRAHDATADDGVSYGYSVKGGWRPSYRETSGYIAVTLFNLYARDRSEEIRAKAIAVSQWLTKIQNSDGSISNPQFGGQEGIVFDTGQVLFGYLRAHQETNEQIYLEAAQKAGNWLVERVESDGAWRRNTHNNIPHTYNSRVAWALAVLGQKTDNERFLDAAHANLAWVMTQEVDGWFENCAFEKDFAPFTHTIAYAIRGLYEAGELFRDAGFQRVAKRVADSVLNLVGDNGFIPGAIDTHGTAHANYVCLTGNCQLAIIWLKLYAKTGEVRYLTAARAALEYVMSTQDLETKNMDIKGAIKGSNPIWGSYAPLSFPNWATKFFIDAILLLEQLEH